VFTLTLLWLLWSPLDAALLAADDFDVRQRATARLAAAGPRALPALLASELSADPEQRHRAARLAAPYRLAARDLWDAAVAGWLFYGCDEDRDALPKYRRFLRTYGPTGLWARSLDNATHRRLAAWARAWGLLRPGEVATCEASAGGNAEWDTVGWVNVCRFRAAGMKAPGCDE
jgi:hypothetical protein